MRNDFDVIIIGAGPAGGAAAFYLASAGVRTLLIEKMKIPRYKTCGGGVVNRVRGILGFEFSSAVEKEIFSSEMFDHYSGINIKVKRDYPIISMVMRERFDEYIVGKASERGAIIADETTVEELFVSPDKILVSCGKSSFHTNVVIAADGFNSFIKRKMKLDFGLRVPALEYEIFPDDNSFLELSGSARFDFGVVPAGYAWVFPKREHLSIGVASLRRNNINLNIILSEYLKLLNIRKIINSQKHGSAIPVKPVTLTAGGQIIFVGDAAGLADPLTAEGISYAIQSARIAAECIIREYGKPEGLKNMYVKRIKSEILYELRYASILGRILYSGDKRRSFLFRNYGRKFCELMTDVISGEKKYSDLMREPINYIKLLSRGYHL